MKTLRRFVFEPFLLKTAWVVDFKALLSLPVPELDLWVTSRPVFVPYTLSFVVSPVTLLSLLSLFFTNVLSGEESNLTSGAGEDDLAAKR
ncbi:hypothetical protein V6N13_136374 [Hibiscus sabdariffa]